MKKIVLILFLVNIFVSTSQTAIINSITATQICVGDTAILTSSNSDAGNSPIISSVWNVSGANGFNYNGATTIGTNLSIVLPYSGFYSITLFNQHEDQTESQTQLLNYLEATKPTANFTFMLSDAAMGDSPFSCPPVVADFTDISEPIGTIESWNWILENNPNNPSEITSISQNPQGVQYLFSGNYDASLIVKDFSGCLDTITRNSYCVIYGPSASISINQTGNENFMEYSFNISNLLNVSTISWDLGNGVIITNDFDGFTYVYPNLGTFNPIVTISDANGCQANCFLGQIQIGVNQIEENSDNSEFKIYPNPTDGKFELKNSTNINAISFLDLNGKLIKEVLFKSESNEIQIDISDLPKGVYNLLVKTNDNQKYLKIVKN